MHIFLRFAVFMICTAIIVQAYVNKHRSCLAIKCRKIFVLYLGNYRKCYKQSIMLFWFTLFPFIFRRFKCYWQQIHKKTMPVNRQYIWYQFLIIMFACNLHTWFHRSLLKHAGGLTQDLYLRCYEIIINLT